MGAEWYDYTVPYEDDVQAALDKLRNNVFESGEFHGAEYGPASMMEAMEMGAEDGTRSILDIMQVADEPEFFCAAPLSSNELEEHFGTRKPTREDVDNSDSFGEDIERGQCRYVVLYDGDVPTQIYFAGYSFD